MKLNKPNLNMLQEFFILELQENPNLLQRVIFCQDGAPPRFAQIGSV
jgi:arsenate reductase-like glutaredoxin family protein